MNISLLSFLVALVVITTLLVILFKQKAKPARPVVKREDSKPPVQQFSEGLVQSKWAEIEAMQKAGPSGLKTALFEADKLLDYCMINSGFAGETMGERLKSGGSRFSNLNAVWAAHKLRNQLAHDVEHDLVVEEVKRAIQSLAAAIRELGIKI